jgi:ABC-2 type transport system permease protein
MNVTVATSPSSSHSPLRSYMLETRCEFMRMLRTPSFSIPTLAFPVLFYLLFGVLLGSRGGAQAGTYLFASYGVFGVMAPGLFGFGVGIAMDRERGFMKLKQAMPAPPGATLMARMLMAIVFAALIVAEVTVIALSLGGVQLSPVQVALLFVVDVLGVLPFCAIGLWVGSLAGGPGAPALVNLIYLPMAFLSGLWMPLHVLPPIFAKIAPVWPAWHLGQLALKVVGRDSGGAAWMHVLVLATMAVVFFLLARRRLAAGARA